MIDLRLRCRPSVLVLPALALLLIAAAAVAAPPEGGFLLRFPDVHDDTVVFVCGEDIWKAPIGGGDAVRLTVHEGMERYPRFSPDGKSVAFTGQYDGNFDVYVMDSDGGGITRATFHPGFDEVVGWHPTNGKVIFTSARHSQSRAQRLFMVNPDGSGLEEVPLFEAAQGDFSADGNLLAYNKMSREGRTWKRYHGGLAQDVFLHDFATGDDRRLTDFTGTDRIPMWIDGGIWFSSDRDGTLNLYVLDPADGAVRQVTRHADYDVRRPSVGGGRIVYELGNDIWLLDAATGESRRLDITIGADAPDARPYLADVSTMVTEAAVSPSGKRALVVARGEVFSVPAEHGAVRNLSADDGARDRDAVWSPDGGRVACLSDRDGEYQIWLLDPAGREEPRKLTDFEDGFRHALRWSPDSKKLSFTDQTLRLWVLDVASGDLTEIDRAEYENIDVSLEYKPIHDHAWSPDSRYIAYAKMEANQLYQISIHDLRTGETRLVGDGVHNDVDPVFSRDGAHLFFVSNRRFDPTLCDFEWEMVYKKSAGIYALDLRANGPLLFPTRSDEEPAGEEGKKEEKKDGDAGIDWDGLADRVEILPLPAGNYRDLAAGDGVLFYLDAPEGDFNRFEFRARPPLELHAFDLAARSSAKVVEGVRGYALSADGSQLVYRTDAGVGLLPAGARDSQGAPLDLAGLKMDLDPRREWRQIFEEAWRLERDYFYEPGMRGLDWDAVGEKYRRLVARATCKQDVEFLLGELIGELSTSHTYVYPGDRRRRAERVGVGLLGADWEAADGRWRLKRVLRATDWNNDAPPPLAAPGVDAREGEYLLAVDGEPVTADRNVLSWFVGTAGRPVVLTLNDRPDAKGAREVVAAPIADDTFLRYLDWVETNRRLVDEMSGGAIGYMHFYDTYVGTARNFGRQFYGQTRKQGLIVDGRYNNGGLDPDIFLARLDKEIHSYWTRRHSHDQTSPVPATRAHMACVTNRQAGSGGDELPAVFRFRGMGPVIGTRTWGGLIGVSMTLSLIDGGALTAPDYRIYSPEGDWIIENVGVKPDIEVELDNAAAFAGDDAQLRSAVEHLQRKIAEEPRPWPEHTDYPQQR